MTEPVNLEPHQVDILRALRALGGHLGWRGEDLVVDGDVVYQTPLPGDPDISGAVFVVEAEEPVIRLYLTFPWSAPPGQRTEALEFAVGCSLGRRFGAVELDPDRGSLRVRVESDASEETVELSVTRVLDRATALAREVSRGWRALACEGASAREALNRCATGVDSATTGTR